MFNQKVILITGASSGLGRALAIEFSRLNAKLALWARDREQLEVTRKLCLEANKQQSIPLLVQGDITLLENCAQAISQTINHYGKLDYLVLNAGLSMWSTFEKIPDVSLLRRLMEVNYLGAVQPAFYALPYLKKNKGMIVAISSTQGKIALPYHSGYSASKHALQGFLDALRMELKDQVSILTVSPGWIRGTNLRKNAYVTTENITQRASGTREKEALTLEFCVQEIIKAMLHRKQELALPAKYRLLPWLKLLCPRLLDRLILQHF